MRSDIPDDDTDAVQKERLALRDEVMRGICGSLREMYGAKYSYDEVRTAEDAVCRELKEPLPARKSVLEMLRRNQQEKRTRSRAKRDEPEL